jgi:hypothetical protein
METFAKGIHSSRSDQNINMDWSMQADTFEGSGQKFKRIFSALQVDLL